MKKTQNTKRHTKTSTYSNTSNRPKEVSQKSKPKTTKQTRAKLSAKPSTVKKKQITPHKRSPNTKSVYGVEQTASPEMRRKALKKQNKLSKSQIRRNRKRRQRRFMLKLCLVMCFTAIGVWGVLKTREAWSKTEVSTQLVKVGTLDLSESYEGIIMRNEKLYTSDTSGMIQYNIGEGEKIKKDGIVYVIVGDEEGLAQVEAEKEVVDDEIYNAADKRKEISYYQDEVSTIADNFETKMQEYYNEINSTETALIYSLRGQLDENVENLTALYTEEQGHLNANVSEKVNIIADNLEKYKSVHKASESGIISYKADGHESLNISNIDKLDYSTYNKILKKSTTESLVETSIEQGDKVYKVVLDNTWYIVTYVSQDKAESFVEGQSYDLNFEVLNGESIHFTLASKIEEDERLRLVFKTQDQMETFLTTRQVSFSIGDKNESGLKIPTQAVIEQRLLKVPVEYKVEKDNKTYVYRKNGELVEQVEIKPQSEIQDMMYLLQDTGNLKGLTVGSVLVHPVSNTTYTLEEFETAQGVYVINGSITQFKKIEIYAQSDEYIIIKNNSNTQLKEKDKIISNPKNITMDQLLEDMTIKNE